MIFRGFQNAFVHNQQPSDAVPIKVVPGAVICTPLDEFATCPNSGLIFIGENTVIHPKVVIESGPECGGIHIGKFNIIEEKVKIINHSQKQLVIGDYNWIQAGSTINAAMIGHMNIIEPRAELKRWCEIENDCLICANCVVQDNEWIASNTMIYGTRCERLRYSSDDILTATRKEDHIKMMEKQYNMLKHILQPLDITKRTTSFGAYI